MSIVIKAGTGLVAGMVAGLLGLAFVGQVAPNVVKPRVAVESPQFVVAKASGAPTVQTAPVAVAPAVKPAPEAKAAEAQKTPEPANRAVTLAPAAPAPTAIALATPETAPSAVATPTPAAVEAQAPVAQPLPTSNEAAARWSVPGLIALAKGDLSTARLFLARAAEAGDARAWVALADTFDPAMLAKLGVVGAPGDPQRAKDYLGKAAAAGIVAARDRMAALDQASGSVR